MAESNYPAVGLQVDLDDFALLNREVDKGVEAYRRLRRAAVEATNIDGADLSAGARRRTEALKSAADQQSALNRRELDQRVAQGRAAYAEEQRLANQSLALRQRLNNQQAAEAARAAVAEQRAAQNLAAVQIREAERAAKGEAAAAVRAAREAEAAERQRLSEFRASMDQRIKAGQQAAREQQRLDEQTYAARRRFTAQQAAEALRAEREQQARLRNQQAGGAVGGGGLFGNIGQNVQRFLQPLTGLRNALAQTRAAFFDVRTAVGVFLGGLIVAPIVRFADAMVALEARIGFFAARQKDVPYLFEAVYQAAQRSRAPLEAVGQLYTRLAPLAEQLGKSQLQLLRVTETVQKGIAIGGATAAEAASSSQQLAQALASNRLGGDELRSLAENAPVLLGAIAKELNMNTGQFIKWAQSGKANAEVVVSALERAGPRIDRLFADFPVTISQGLTVVTNAFTKFIGEVNRITGLGEAIGNALVDFSRFIESDKAINATASAIQNLGAAFSFLGGVIKGLVAALPAIGAALLVVAARAAITSKAVQTTAFNFALLSAAVGRNAAAMIVAQNAATVAATRLGGALKATFAFFGGPIGVAIIAVAGAYAYLADTQRKVAESSENLLQSQEGAVDALDRAIAFADAYGVSNDNLTNTLEGVIKGSSDAAQKALAGIEANDAAGRAAILRAERERLLTVNILRRAAADAQARGGQDLDTAARLRAEGNVLRFAAQYGPDDPGYRALAEQKAVEKFNQARDLARSATGNYQLATGLSQAQTEVARADLDISKPNDKGLGGNLAANADKATKGLDGAINRLAKMSAEVKGLQAQIAALDVDPLSDVAARIKAAGDEAAAQYTSGKAADAGFAARARAVAVMKEELQIRLDLTKALIEQRRSEEEELELLKLESDGRQRAEGIMQAYFSRGVSGYQAYVAAVEAAKDAQAEAAISASNLQIALQYGVKSIDQIAEAYIKATGASEEDAQALEDQARQTASAAASTILFRNEMDKSTDRVKAQTDALEELQKQRTDLANLERSTTVGSEVRGAAERVARIQQSLLTQAVKDRVALTDEEARAQAEVLAIELERRANLAQMKIDIQDSIRQSFIDTGKLDFSSLRQGVTRALRQAVYDSLIANPINIVVNAVVNIATQAIQNALSGILGSLTGGAGGTGTGLLGGLASLLGASSPQDRAVQPLIDAARSLTEQRGDFSALLRSMPNILQQGVKSLGYAAVGNTLYGAVGGRQNTGSMVGSAIGSVAGGALAGSALGTGLGNALGIASSALGPIGMVVGSILGSALGSLFGGKPSNNGALATFDASGNSFSLAGNKRTEQTSNLATAAAQAILAGRDALKNAGITLTDSVHQIDIGTRDATDIVLTSGRKLTSAVGDAAAAAETALKALLQSANYADPAVKNLVENMLAAGSAFDDIAKKLEAFAQAQAFTADVNRQILKFTNPREFEIANLQDQQKARRKQAQAYYDEQLLSAEQFAKLGQQLSILDQLELDDLLKNLADTLTQGQKDANDAVDKARDALQQAYDRERASIVENINKLTQLSAALGQFLDSLNTGPLALNDPATQYARTRRDLLAAGAGAATGDLDAAGRIPALGQAFLEAAKNNAVTRQDYLRDLATTKNIAQAAKNGVDNQLSLAEQQLAALDASVATLLDINTNVISVQQAIINLNAALAAQEAANQAALQAAQQQNQQQQNQNQAGNQDPPLAQGALDFADYIARNGDVAAEYNRLVNDKKGRAELERLGIDSATEFGEYHYNVSGKGEGRQIYTQTMPSTLSAGAPSGSANDNSALAAQLAIMNEYMEEIATNTQTGAVAANKTAKTLKNWDYDGQPDVRQTNLP